MSAEHILALAQILQAARAQAKATEAELRRLLGDLPPKAVRGTPDDQTCYLVDPERRIWRICWAYSTIVVEQIPSLDVQEPTQRNGVRSAQELLDF